MARAGGRASPASASDHPRACPCPAYPVSAIRHERTRGTHRKQSRRQRPERSRYAVPRASSACRTPSHATTPAARPPTARARAGRENVVCRIEKSPSPDIPPPRRPDGKSGFLSRARSLSRLSMFHERNRNGDRPARCLMVAPRAARPPPASSGSARRSGWLRGGKEWLHSAAR